MPCCGCSTGKRAWPTARRRFEAEFAPLRVSVEQIHAFLGRLHEMGLLLADAPGQGQQLIERRARRQKQFWMAALTNVLAIRLPGIDPAKAAPLALSQVPLDVLAVVSRPGRCRGGRGRRAGLGAVRRLPGEAAGSSCVPHAWAM